MKTLVKVLEILMLGAAAVGAQGVIRTDFIRNTSGNAAANKVLQVCTVPPMTIGPPCQPLANIYTDPDLASNHQIDQSNMPLTTDSTGKYSFYAVPGRYYIQVLDNPITVLADFPDAVLAHDPPTVVLVANTFPGTDIGDKINKAIAALPTGGGTILISPGTYNFSTPIQLKNDQQQTSPARNVTLSGSGEGFDNTVYGTRLVWTGGPGDGGSTTGIAIKLTNPTGNSVTMRLSNFSLDTASPPGAVGIDIDGTNHTFIEHVTINPIKASAFSTGIRVGHMAQTVDVTLRDVLVANNDIGLLAENVSAGLLLDHARFEKSTHENVKVMGGGAGSPVLSFHAYGSAFDATSTTASSVSILNCALCVFENDYFEHFAGTFAIDIPSTTQQGVQAFSTVI